MIINISKVKTEALLLFIRDLIDSYKNTEERLFELSSALEEFVDIRIAQLYKAMRISIQPSDYYRRNKNVSRIAMIFKAYESIEKTLTKLLKKNTRFNPSMLCFSLLCTWFAELGKERNSKEFLYFSLYPYSEIYDTLILKTEHKEYKALNIAMLQIAEKTISHLNHYEFK